MGENEFKLIKTNHPIFNAAYNDLKFRKMENGKYIAGFGKGQDFSELTGLRSKHILVLNLITLVTSILYFLISNLINLINKFRNKEKSILTKETTRIQLTGLIISILLIIMTIFILSNPLLNFKVILTFRIIFSLLYLLCAFLVYRGIKLWKEPEFKNKRNFVFSVIFISSIISLLVTWGI